MQMLREVEPKLPTTNAARGGPLAIESQVCQWQLFVRACACLLTPFRAIKS